MPLRKEATALCNLHGDAGFQGNTKVQQDSMHGCWNNRLPSLSGSYKRNVGIKWRRRQGQHELGAANKNQRGTATATPEGQMAKRNAGNNGPLSHRHCGEALRAPTSEEGAISKWTAGNQVNGPTARRHLRSLLSRATNTIDGNRTPTV